MASSWVGSAVSGQDSTAGGRPPAGAGRHPVCRDRAVMGLFDARAARVTLTVAALLMVAGLVYLLRDVLLLLVFSLFFAYLLYPVVRLVERCCWRRVWAILTVYALLLVTLGLLGGVTG